MIQISNAHMEKFWGRVTPEGPIHPELGTECWLWTGWTAPDGYGRIYVGRRGMNAHRFAWLILRGAIPDGLCICHHCDNPPCVNPDHLFLGSRETNNKDRNIKGRGPDVRGLANPNSKLFEDDIQAIRRRFKKKGEDNTVKKLAKDFDVTDVMIYNIISGRSWGHVV